MHAFTQPHTGFEFLEIASREVNSWPTWKKELAGLCCSSNDKPTNKAQTIHSESDHTKKLIKT